MPTTRRTTRVDQAGVVVGPRRRASFTSRALVLLLVVAVLGVSYASSIRAWLNQRSEQNSLAAQIADQRAAIAQLRREAARYDDPAFIETEARLRFGWVMPGERSYRVIGKDGTVLSVGNDTLTSPLPASPTHAPPWWAGAVGSLAQSDATPVAPKKPTLPTRTPVKVIGPSAGAPSGR